MRRRASIAGNLKGYEGLGKEKKRGGVEGVAAWEMTSLGAKWRMGESMKSCRAQFVTYAGSRKKKAIRLSAITLTGMEESAPCSYGQASSD